MFHLFAYAEGSAAQMQNGSATFLSLIMQFIPFILIIFILYFLLIRPQKKQQEEHAKMLENLKSGDKVLTAGGILGTVANAKNDDFITIFISDGVKIKIQKQSIITVIKPKDEKNANENVK